jgi:hypothetical protein
VLILPPGHAQNVGQRYKFHGRERWIIGGLAGTVAVLIVALVISFANPGPKSGHGCISVALAFSMGGSSINRCGASARAFCLEVGKPAGLTGQAAETVTGACRKAGLPVG